MRGFPGITIDKLGDSCNGSRFANIEENAAAELKRKKSRRELIAVRGHIVAPRKLPVCVTFADDHEFPSVGP